MDARAQRQAMRALGKILLDVPPHEGAVEIILLPAWPSRLSAISMPQLELKPPLTFWLPLVEEPHQSTGHSLV